LYVAESTRIRYWREARARKEFQPAQELLALHTFFSSTRSSLPSSIGEALKPSAQMLKPSRSILLTRKAVTPSNCTAQRRSLLHSSSSRHFHASPPARAAFDQTLLLAHDALYSLHSLTGLPWVAAIPLTALLVRTTFITPLSIYEHVLRRRRRRLVPLLSAWQGAYVRALRRERQEDAGMTHEGGIRVVEANLRVTKKRLYRDWGATGYVPTVIFSTALQIGIGIHFIECVRRMCGSQASLLWLLAKGSGDAAAETPLIPAEPSMATEGALWFPDLLAADPTFTLPFVLSASFYFGMFFNQRLSPTLGTGPPSKWRKRLERAAPVAILMIIPLWINVPAGIMVYLISASVIRSTESILLRLLLPDKLPPSIHEPKKE
jgi:mitochondrial inner membrane protein COX18